MQPSPDTYEVRAIRLLPGDLVMGMLVHKVVTEGRGVTITYDSGRVQHAHADDIIEVDSYADRNWVRFEPLLDDDGDRYGWTLVLSADSDWQRWSFTGEGGRQEFRLEIGDPEILTLAQATVVPTTAILLAEEKAHAE